MIVKILDSEKKIFNGNAVKVVLPTLDGEICILPNHIAIVTLLRNGCIKIFESEYSPPELIKVSGGICSFSDNVATFIL